MVPHKVIDSFNAAIEGIILVLKKQRNMRVHFIVAALILVLSVILNMEVVDLLLLLSAITLVLVTEMINTAIERITDMVKATYHPQARIIKDVGAGAVLIAALYSVMVGYLVFFKKKYLLAPLRVELEHIRSSNWHIAFVCLMVVAILTVIIKIAFHRGSLVKGGMPSLHAALSFAVFTLVALLPGTPDIVVVLVFFVALLVAQSRIASRIHTFYEVTSGAIWGMVITFFLFKLFSG